MLSEITTLNACFQRKHKIENEREERWS